MHSADRVATPREAIALVRRVSEVASQNDVYVAASVALWNHLRYAQRLYVTERDGAT